MCTADGIDQDREPDLRPSTQEENLGPSDASGNPLKNRCARATGSRSAVEDRASNRLTSLDAFRGLVMLLLIPDVFGGFSFYEMARRIPDSSVWTTLARNFTHAPWSGATIWDLIMPAFVFMVGASMPYSYAARRREGHAHGDIVVHAALRAIALLTLGVLFLIPARHLLDSLWPVLILALGLPVPAWLSRMFRHGAIHRSKSFEWMRWGVILGAAAVKIALELHRVPSFYLHDILTQAGLGYLFAFLMVDRGRRAQWWCVAAILTVYWLAFALYPLPSADVDLSALGVMRGDEIFSGWFAHWNKGTNFAAAFDRWFLNLLPRPTPFAFNSHGYQTLNFIPTVASMVLGVMVGEHLRSDKPRAVVRNGLVVAGGLALLGGLLAGWTLAPLVKSIWTPSWVLFSTGCVVLAFTLFYHVIDVRGHRGWTFPLVVAGRNPLVLYTLAIQYRWWVLAPWRHTMGSALAPLSWSPVLESVVCMLTLWLVALALYRAKVFVRL